MKKIIAAVLVAAFAGTAVQALASGKTEQAKKEEKKDAKK